MPDATDHLHENYGHFRPQYAGQADDLSARYMRANILPCVATAGLPKDARILELGPGQGLMLHMLRQQGYSKLEGFDVCHDYAAALTQQGYHMHDATSLEQLLGMLADGAYDLLIAVDVFEHIARDQLVTFLLGFRRKLRHGGRIIGQVPNSSGLFGANTFLADPTHVTPFNEISMQSLLRGCGYEQVAIHDVRLPPSWINLLRSLVRQVIFKMCYVMMQVVGATPVKHLSHLILFEAVAPVPGKGTNDASVLDRNAASV